MPSKHSVVSTIAAARAKRAAAAVNTAPVDPPRPWAC